jgi:hypothetical protein
MAVNLSRYAERWDAMESPAGENAGSSGFTPLPLEFPMPGLLVN